MSELIQQHLFKQNAVVCHDAGAANLILSWLKDVSLPIRAHMVGPAAALWAEAFPERPVMSLNQALSGSNCLLSGTSWQSSVEHKARLQAKAKGLYSIAVLDHWVNYRDRFIWNDEEVLPDEIWVSDEEAYRGALSLFPNKVIKKFPNDYLAEQVALIKSLSPKMTCEKTRRVIYLLEPIRRYWEAGDSRPGEFQALDYFLSNLSALDLGAATQIRLRLHPSEASEKYDEWLASQYGKNNISFAPKQSLSEDLAWADYVVGCETFGLVIGHMSGKISISTLPHWGHRCRLPEKYVIRLCDMVKLKAEENRKVIYEK